jgi:hypothetical protein
MRSETSSAPSYPAAGPAADVVVDSPAMGSPAGADLSLPDLRFVPVETLVPHEQHDEHRLQMLVERIREQAVLKNPPVVAPLAAEDSNGGRFVVLDGANRATAARAAGYPHMLVQVVRYPDPGVLLSTWYHAFGSLQRPELEKALDEINGLVHSPAQPMHARAMLARREALAWIAYENAAVALHGGGDIHERNALLNAVVDIYRNRGRFYRVTSDSLHDVRVAHPEVTALVVFPHFDPAEILEVASSGARLPAGITRHVIRWRALRLNLPLSRLADTGQSLEEKNQWLEGWLKEMLSQRHVRFYEEPTVLFDE